MNFFRRFVNKEGARKGTKPIQVVWKHVGFLELKGSHLLIGDSWSPLYDPVLVEAPTGRYEVSAECFSYGTDERVARLRVLLEGSTPDASEAAGDFAVDVGSAGVSDADLIERYADQNPDGYEHWTQAFADDQCQRSVDMGVSPFEAAGTAMVYVSSGFGDGVYDVLKLMQNGRPVGAEAIFLRPDQGYFEDD